MKKLYKIFNHNKEYISKYIYDYDVLMEKADEESENIDNVNDKFDIINKNIIILKALFESSYAELINLINKKIENKIHNDKKIGAILMISSFILSIILSCFLYAWSVPNIMCLIAFIIGIYKFFDKQLYNDLIKIVPKNLS